MDLRESKCFSESICWASLMERVLYSLLEETILAQKVWGEMVWIRFRLQLQKVLDEINCLDPFQMAFRPEYSIKHLASLWIPSTRT